MDTYTHVYHQYTIRVPASERDQIVSQLNDRGIGARVYYPSLIHKQPALNLDSQFDLPESEKVTQEVISLPVHAQLTQEEREYIVDMVNELCASLQPLHA